MLYVTVIRPTQCVLRVRAAGAGWAPFSDLADSRAICRAADDLFRGGGDVVELPAIARGDQFAVDEISSFSVQFGHGKSSCGFFARYESAFQRGKAMRWKAPYASGNQFE